MAKHSYIRGFILKNMVKSEQNIYLTCQLSHGNNFALIFVFHNSELYQKGILLAYKIVKPTFIITRRHTGSCSKQSQERQAQTNPSYKALLS